MARRRRRRSEEKKCAYCDRSTFDWTWDEPVPQCLFDKPRDNLISVPACLECNSTHKSKDDTFLRDMLALNGTIAEHPDGRAVIEAFNRAELKGKSANIVRKYGKWSYDPKTHLYLPTVEIEKERVTRIFKWIIRGLYFHDHEKPLAENYRYGCARTSREDAEKREAAIADLGFHPKWFVGSRGQFRYFHVWFEDPNVTFWQLIFYDREFFIASTAPPGIYSLEDFENDLERKRQMRELLDPDPA